MVNKLITLDALSDPDLLASLAQPLAPSFELILGICPVTSVPIHFRVDTQQGGNIAIIGRDQQVASGLLCSLAAQLYIRQANTTHLRVSDLPRIVDSGIDGESAMLPRMMDGLGLGFKLEAGFNQQLTSITEIYNEIRNRIKKNLPAPRQEALIILNIQNLHQLRLTGDYTQPRRLQIATAFRSVLKLGPQSGFHSIIWCDSNSSLRLCLGRLASSAFRTRCFIGERQDPRGCFVLGPRDVRRPVVPFVLADGEIGHLADIAAKMSIPSLAI
jgi:hypothetical protein